jgi:hypothetical protein
MSKLTDRVKRWAKMVAHSRDYAVITIAEELSDEISTLRWQLNMLANDLTMADCSLSRFLVLRDVTEAELDKLHDVFEAQDKVMKIKEVLSAETNWPVFGETLVSVLPDRKDVAPYEIVISFKDGHRWKAVCDAYLEWYRKEQASCC